MKKIMISSKMLEKLFKVSMKSVLFKYNIKGKNIPTYEF